MKKNDAELIQRTLDGDQSAFTALVEKYQKGVHALVWQKIGDFHIAQEITQDAFLRAYQNLGTLKNHSLFSGWLYVIATRLCYEWCRKKRIPVQSLETLDTKEVDKVAYSQYIEELRETDADDARRELVRNLLKKLPESERTVMTLHYLGEMSCESISEFLGVSSNTIRSRLSRARNRLRKEEAMIKENLNSFQLPTQFTANIMEKISQLKPTTTTTGKPFVPWALSAASAVLVVLLMGVGTMKLHRYQTPYSLDASSESAIEIIDARVFVESQTETENRNRVGKATIATQNNGNGQNSEDPLFAAAQLNQTEGPNVKQQWIQTTGPEGGTVQSLFKTARGDVFAGTEHGLYRLNDDATGWQYIFNIKGPSYKKEISRYLWWPLAEWNHKIYLANDSEILVSNDRGNTWKTFVKSKKGQPIGMTITDRLQDAEREMIIYLAYPHGVFRTDDSGESWQQLSEGLTDRTIRSIVKVENTVFVGTDNGVFRFGEGQWEQITVVPTEEQDQIFSILDMVATENHIYVLLGGEITYDVNVGYKIMSLSHKGWTLYRSNDIGNSWECIDPRNYTGILWGDSVDTRIDAFGDNVLVSNNELRCISNDIGENWIQHERIGLPSVHSNISILLYDSKTFYDAGWVGIYRTTDEGKTWHQFNAGLIASSVENASLIDNTLYINESNVGILASNDFGQSWKPITWSKYDLKQMVDYNGVLYVSEGNRPIRYLLSDKSQLTRIQDMPEFAMIKSLPVYTTNSKILLAVSDSAFYVEFNNQLLRWKRGTPDWHNTELKYEDNDSKTNVLNFNFKIAVSGKSLYVGIRNGQLMQSFDEGDTWNNATENLPFSVKDYHAIVFANESAYIATDKGVLRSNNGIDWHQCPDMEGMPIEVIKFNVDGNRLYGLANNSIYQLREAQNTWKRVTPEIPYSARCFDVENKNIFVGTLGRGVLRFTIKD